MGAEVSVVADTAGGNFIGWVNEWDAIVSLSGTYSFTASGNDYLKALYKTDVEGANAVIFKNAKAAAGKGQILEMQYYVAGDEVVFPDAPSQAGYDFTGWCVTTEEIKTALAAGEDITVAAEWTPAKTYIDVTVSGGKIITEAQQNGKYLAYNLLTVVADTAPEGKKFAYWIDAKGNIMSYDAEYKNYPAQSIELNAIYIEEDEETDYQPLVFISANPTTQGEKITYTLSWEVNETVGEVVSAGLIVVDKGEYNADTFYHTTEDIEVFDRVLDSEQITQKNTYNIGKSESYYNHTYIARVFVVYNDMATGKSVTVYSDEIETYKFV